MTQGALNVMPVKTGIQELRGFPDTGFCRHDVCGYFSDGFFIALTARHKPQAGFVKPY